MQLLEQKIGFPLLGFNDVKITLTAPFIPTTMEKVVVKIIGRFASDDIYRMLPLQQIFTNILGVPEPDFILRKTLDELFVKRIIRCEHPVSDMTRQQVRFFSLTEQGQQLLRENILHGVVQERSENYFYDPIADKLIRESLGWQLQKPQTTIDETAFTQTLPSTQIQNDLTKNKPAWFTPQTQIESVEVTTEPRVFWKQQSFTFNIKDGTLTTQCNEQNDSSKYANYINSLSADMLFEKIFANSFIGNLSDWKSFPLMKYEELAKLPKSDWMIINGRFEDFANKPNIACFSPDWIGYKTDNDKYQCSANRLYFDPRLEKPFHIYSNKSRHISIQGEYPFGDVFCVTEKYALQGVRISLRFNGEQLQLPVMIRQPHNKTNQFVTDFLSGVVALANIRNNTDTWANQNKRWQKLIDRFWDNFMLKPF
ncbi:MAG: hypothetical protein LBH59_07765 [Planctomycetaceae bacterium]|jgi:hypothetical protein|nr:hypothetical protein [Planctomycetaceae bacterium]